MYHITDYELELMKIIWSNNNKALYAEIVEGLEVKDNHWTKNTIITLLSRLIEKGLLKTNKIGRRNEYIAIVPETDYQAGQTVQFLDKIFEGNTKGLVATLIEKELLTPEDYEDLKKHWEGGGDKQ